MAFVQLLLFPGLAFLFVMGLAAEFVDRKLYARFQNRVGPPWFQPAADFVKLLSKENLIPDAADRPIFGLMPILAFASAVTAYFYVPTLRSNALFSFDGDLIVVLYFLTIPTLTFFLAGWYSRSAFSMIGAIRSMIQLFAYEVPLFLCLLAAALLADTWSVSGVASFYANHPPLILINLPGFAVSLMALLGKLEKVPFDIPEAETEIVAGSFTEYGGKSLAFFKAAINVEMVVAASLLAAIFLPFGFFANPILSAVVYIAKVFFIVFLIALARSVAARLRLDQMVVVCWKIFGTVSFGQIVLNLLVKGWVPR